MVWHFPLERKLHGRRAFDQKLARAHDERSIRVSNPRCKLTESTRVASVRVRSEQHLGNQKMDDDKRSTWEALTMT